MDPAQQLLLNAQSLLLDARGPLRWRMLPSPCMREAEVCPVVTRTMRHLAGYRVLMAVPPHACCHALLWDAVATHVRGKMLLMPT